jgi:hypothetical protein
LPASRIETTIFCREAADFSARLIPAPNSAACFATHAASHNVIHDDIDDADCHNLPRLP